MASTQFTPQEIAKIQASTAGYVSPVSRHSGFLGTLQDAGISPKTLWYGGIGLGVLTLVVLLTRRK